MTTTTTPVANLADTTKDRASSTTNPKQHADYTDRAEPRSLSIDYTSTNTNGSTGVPSTYSSRQHQQGHYGQNQAGNNSVYSEDYYDNSNNNNNNGQQQDHYNNTHSHHSSSSSSSSHYPHGTNGSSYLPPPIQTAAFAGHNDGKNGDSSLYPQQQQQQQHGHAQAIHGSFVSPTSPTSSGPLSPNGAQQAYAQGHHEYSQSHAHHSSHHSYHTSYAQEHQHPLSPTEGNGHHAYSSHPIPTVKADNSNGASNGSYSSSNSSYYSRNYPYNSNTNGYSYNNSNNGHSHAKHGSIDEQPRSPDEGFPTGPDPSSSLYSTSAPSPSMGPQSPTIRVKRREVFPYQESPYFYPTQQLCNLFSPDQSMSYNIKIAAKIDRGFFLASNDWTCYRRNYFQLSASFGIQGLDSSIHSEVPCLLERNGELLPVRSFLVCIGAQIQNGEKVIELVQHTPKRDKGPQITPRPTHIRAGGDLNANSPGSYVITFERVQFKTATANNGKRRAAQQYYQVHVDLFAELESGDLILAAKLYSAPLVVRGRSPGHYAENDEDLQDGAQSVDSRHHYRNDSVSSISGAPLGSPVSPGEYPYYSGYAYGSSYPYQSLTSASHMAHSQDAGYYNNNRKDSESYPGSPLSPASIPHAISHAGESVSPDMYSPAGFVGPESPALSIGRASHSTSHYGGNNSYGHYSSSYSSQQQHYDSYRDQDHTAQMAGLRIHSPSSPKPSSVASSPLVTPRRQSFSSTLISKSTERSVGGSTTRKSRSISLSGTTTTTTVSKRPISNSRPSRTVPATPPNEMHGRGVHGVFSKDRIPESPMEDQHL
ncbi:hypothetical protein BGZ96_011028 [Linnemannia gamsii]|uniref:NDT80 domain-containing protein n=1 Tax=Linnemannia gamsii TaxID=64522 RepID=A0ABQ7JU26_9FUNG|nr:hypothetical protein BGZ96_011028 [Linnemannia gamsii]